MKDCLYSFEVSLRKVEKKCKIWTMSPNFSIYFLCVFGKVTYLSCTSIS